MAFRTIVIKNRCKLEYSLNYLVCRGEDEKKILLDEIEFLIIQNTGVAITCALLSALVEKKVKVIFCDGKSNPQAELTPYYNNYSTYKKIQQQINFQENTKLEIWSSIIRQKILHQSLVLKECDLTSSYEKLVEYLNQIELGDVTNREGHAAKVYFNALFGNKFSRDDDQNVINKYLNYGYSIIVSCINREIKMLGYLTEIGVHHIGETNAFNLSYDFFEPLRPFIDIQVIKNRVDEDNYKDYFIRLLQAKVFIKGNAMFLDNAIHIYIQSLFSALIKNNPDEIQYIDYEL